MVTAAQRKSQRTIQRYATRRRERDKPRYESPTVTKVVSITGTAAKPSETQVVTEQVSVVTPRPAPSPISPTPTAPQVQQPVTPTQAAMEAGTKPLPTPQITPSVLLKRDGFAQPGMTIEQSRQYGVPTKFGAGLGDIHQLGWTGVRKLTPAEARARGMIGKTPIIPPPVRGPVTLTYYGTEADEKAATQPVTKEKPEFPKWQKSTILSEKELAKVREKTELIYKSQFEPGFMKLFVTKEQEKSRKESFEKAHTYFTKQEEKGIGGQIYGGLGKLGTGLIEFHTPRRQPGAELGQAYYEAPSAKVLAKEVGGELWKGIKEKPWSFGAQVVGMATLIGGPSAVRGVTKAVRTMPKYRPTYVSVVEDIKPGKMIGKGTLRTGVEEVARESFAKGKVYEIKPRFIRKKPKITVYDTTAFEKKLGVQAPKQIETISEVGIKVEPPKGEPKLAIAELTGFEQPSAKGFFAVDKGKVYIDTGKKTLFTRRPKIREVPLELKTTGVEVFRAYPKDPILLATVEQKPFLELGQIRGVGKGIGVYKKPFIEVGPGKFIGAGEPATIVGLGRPPTQLLDLGEELFKLQTASRIGKVKRITKLPIPFVEKVTKKPVKLFDFGVGKGFFGYKGTRAMAGESLTDVGKYKYGLIEVASFKKTPSIIKKPFRTRIKEELLGPFKGKKAQKLVSPEFKSMETLIAEEKAKLKLPRLKDVTKPSLKRQARLRTGPESIKKSMEAAVREIATPQMKFVVKPKLFLLGGTAVTGMLSQRARSELKGVERTISRAGTRSLTDLRAISRSSVGVTPRSIQAATQRTITRTPTGFGKPSLVTPPLVPPPFILFPLGGPWLPRWGAKKPSVTKPRPFAYVPSITAFEFGVVGEPLRIGKRGFLTGLAIRPLAKKVELPKFNMRGY